MKEIKVENSAEQMIDLSLYLDSLHTLQNNENRIVKRIKVNFLKQYENKYRLRTKQLLGLPRTMLTNAVSSFS